MTFSEHAIQVHALLRAFSAALKSRIDDIEASASSASPDALAARVISRIFEDGIGVIGHFAGQIENNLRALGLDVPGALPPPLPAQQPGNQRTDSQGIEAARGAKLVEIEAKRVALLGEYLPEEIEAWRGYPARVYAAGNGSAPPLTQAEQDEFHRLSRIDRIEAHAAGLRARAGGASSEAELGQIIVADGWP